MSCASCAGSIESLLKHSTGIQSVSVSAATNEALVEYDEKQTDAKAIRTLVQSLGYDLVIEKKVATEKGPVQESSIRRKLVVAFVFAIPVFVISMVWMHQKQLGILLMILSLPVVLYSGSGFYIRAWKQAQHRQVSMDTLVAISTGIAFIFSILIVLALGFWEKRGLHAHYYFEAATSVILFILTGKFIEARAKSGTGEAIRQLIGLQSDQALLIENGHSKLVPIATLNPGQHVLVKPGDKIPADGTIHSGFATIDESSLNGEPVPAGKTTGDKVFSGSICLDGSIEVIAEQTGESTWLARIIESVRIAQNSKAQVQELADKVATVFVPVVLGIALLTLTLWLLLGGTHKLEQGLLAMVSVLVIACPCALGLATPMALTVGIGRCAKKGILIRDANALQTAATTTDVVLDKTGTLTSGSPEISRIDWTLGEDTVENMQLFASLCGRSSHPLSATLGKYLNTEKLLTLLDFTNISGRGITAMYGSESLAAGNAQMMFETTTIIPVKRQLGDIDETPVFLSRNAKLIAVAWLKDPLRSGSKSGVANLKASGIKVHLLSGDREETVRHIAGECGISFYKSRVMPEEKAMYIRQLQAEGKQVAMVGDGINDSQALAQADTGIAMGSGSDIALHTAGISLSGSNPELIAEAIQLSSLTLRNIRQNLFWAFLYNLIGIPIAAGILFPWTGYMLSPEIAGAAMAFSSISVVLNSLRLRTAPLQSGTIIAN